VYDVSKAISSQTVTFYKSVGTYFVTIPVNDEDNGKILRIDITCPYEGSVNNIQDVYLGDEGAILKYEISNKLLGFSTCLLLIFIGLIFICVSIPLRKYDNGGNSLAYLGMFAVSVGTWSMTEVKLLHLLFGNVVLWHFITGLTLILIPVPIFIFFRNKHAAATKTPVYIVGCLSVVVYVISIFMHFSGFADLHETITLAHLLLVVCIIFTAYYAFRCFIVSKCKDTSFYGLIVVAICAALDIIFYYLHILQDNSTLTRVGVLVYICILGFQVINNYIKNYNTMLKADLLSKLAYVDILTELNNRTAFNEDIAKLDEEKRAAGKIVAMFDVNSLKYINDNLGHSIGDKAIVEAAERISEYFGALGKCYRIGGDEFVFISDSAHAEEAVQKAYTEFFKSLELRENSGVTKEYPLYIAYGSSVVGDDGSVTNAFNKADALMYENKRLIKETKHYN
jgi:diguanylate cyclase (GGDEF)-like protein